MRRALRVLAALPAVMFVSAAEAAYTIKASVPGTVTATTYFSSGAFHGAVDISSGRCNYWGVETGLVGSLHWNVTIRTTAITCYSSGSGNQNEAKHVFADGWTYRILNFIKTADSYDKTCDRCQIGNDSGMVHYQWDKNGTLNTAWYSGYTTKGEAVAIGETIGVLN
jgi:hypothetical protein